MKRLLFILLTWFGAQSFYAQESILLPYDATTLTGEQRASNPERLAYPTGMKARIADEVNFRCNTPDYGFGPFSVSDRLQVIFSRGNLQFRASDNTWRFAERQWDYVGNDNGNISGEYAGWIDLFGWGSSGWEGGVNAFLPWSTSDSYTDYIAGNSPENSLQGEYANADWAVYNRIGNDAPGTWRTLSYDEWYFLLYKRHNSEKLRGFAIVGSVEGVVLLPDTWPFPERPFFSHKDFNKYSASEWEEMEIYGAVFLPAAGARIGLEIEHYEGLYWSVTPIGDWQAYGLRFYPGEFMDITEIERAKGCSVRPVQTYLEMH